MLIYPKKLLQNRQYELRSPKTMKISTGIPQIFPAF